jgi:hypothetical protein
MLQEKRDQRWPHQTMVEMMQKGTRILPSWGSHLWRTPQWRKALQTRHQVRENGAVAVARHREDRGNGTAVLRGHHDRTGDPTPSPHQRRRDLGFGLGPPPPHPRLLDSIRSSSALRWAWTSRCTKSGEGRGRGDDDAMGKKENLAGRFGGAGRGAWRLAGEWGGCAASWREREGGGGARDPSPATMGGDAFHSASSGVVARRLGVGERDARVAWSSDAQAVGGERRGVFCNLSLQPTGCVDAMYVPLAGRVRIERSSEPIDEGHARDLLVILSDPTAERIMQARLYFGVLTYFSWWSEFAKVKTLFKFSKKTLFNDFLQYPL